jgi:ubiquinone/menaquinone biosynthesis C-methylase UbiE
MKADNKYSLMQKNHYEAEASVWTVEDRNPVVGSFDSHNLWKGYENLFQGIDDLEQKICLDFGCGPGRSISLYYDRFKQIDGVDISENNLINAKKWLDFNGQTQKETRLYLCNGIDLSEIPDNQYDIIISTIAMQHICVYAIRFNYLKEFYRILKPGGIISIQMGYGPQTASKISVPYYANNYEALETNGRCDTRVESPDQLRHDLEEIGFKHFQYTIGETGPGDAHENWIYFKATK